MRVRAERLADTRRRIVEATVALHEELGPARTTVAAIAERAGVSRPTVYSQFPDDRSLFHACGTAWAELHPLPELDGDSLENVLCGLYGHYRANQRMLGHVFRDAELLPAIAEVVGHLGRPLAEAAERYGRELGGRVETCALVRLAFAFPTWRLLSEAGFTDEGAAALMARAAACA